MSAVEGSIAVPEGGTVGTASESPPVAGPWARGFHGMLVAFDDRALPSLAQIAMARRSTGLLRMDVLVDLPRSSSERDVPRGRAQHVATPRVASDGSVLSPPTLDADATIASLSDTLDERLARARFLFLPNQGRGYAVAKRTLDLVGAIVLIVLTAPLMVALAVLIRLDSPGPAVFRQNRVTRGGRIFRFYKFRTMYVDARERFPELYAYAFTPDDNGATYYKLADDPRNTRVGRWLRRTTLDELPNLFNVLRGDISLVGPRPDLPELVLQYRPEELACLFTKAGLTGVAQVAGRSLLTVRERLTLDLRYVAQQTLLLDLRILWRTVIVVLSGKGAF